MAPTLRLYNTLTRTKEDFVPIDPSNVRMYVCGPTVYDYAHIGNARPVIVFDLLFRLLRHLYGPEHVTYVRNVTDVDDKINARAAERGVPIRDMTEGTLAQFHADIAALGVLEPTRRAAGDRAHRRDADADRAPRRERPRLCRRGARALRRAVDAGLRPAVEAPARRDGGGRPRRRRALQALAARFRAVEAVEAGRAVAGRRPPGSPTPGRPGWHIECSAMSWKHLGEAFDIHGGGIDLVFPHHENEVAQTALLVRHAGDGERLDAQRLPPGRGREDVQEPGEFRDDQRALGDGCVRRAELARRGAAPCHADARTTGSRSTGRCGRWRRRRRLFRPGPHSRFAEEDEAISGEVLEALSDDLNTPQAIAALHALERTEQLDCPCGELLACARVPGIAARHDSVAGA